MKVKDPICGMEMEPGEEHSRIVYKEKEFHFCSFACEELFKEINGIASHKKPGQAELERKMIAYNILKQLAITVAHYIRNANAAISAQAQLCSTSRDLKFICLSMEIIKKESNKIELIVNTLLSLSDIKLRKYASNEEEAIIDLHNTLEEKLNREDV